MELDVKYEAEVKELASLNIEYIESKFSDKITVIQLHQILGLVFGLIVMFFCIPKEERDGLSK